MAREAYRSLYGDLTKLKDGSLLKNPDARSGGDELLPLLLAASVQVDRLCNRHFFSLTATRVFDGSGSDRLMAPDLISVTSLKADEDDDQSYEAVWSSRDYVTEPYNQDPTAHWGGPYTSLLARKTGSKRQFLAGQRRYQITGKWGYSEMKEKSGSLVGEVTSGSPDLRVSDGGDFSAGQTIHGGLGADAGEGNQHQRHAAGHARPERDQADEPFGPLDGVGNPVAGASRAGGAHPDGADVDGGRRTSQPFYVDADLDTDVRLLLDSYRLPASLV